MRRDLSARSAHHNGVSEAENHQFWGYRLKSPGHVLVVDCNNGELFGRIQYFISSDIEESVYRVNIAKNVGDLVRPFARGHLYSYYTDGPKGGYHGEVSELTPKVMN